MDAARERLPEGYGDHGGAVGGCRGRGCCGRRTAEETPCATRANDGDGGQREREGSGILSRIALPWAGGREPHAEGHTARRTGGRHWLIGHLLTFGFEVATPVRDRGVDLVVYEDRAENFTSLPVQLKASTCRAFGIHKKYAKTRNLVLAYVWDMRPEQTPTAYVLTVAETISVADAMGYTATPSWAKGAYTTTNPSKKLLEHLKPFASSLERWKFLLRREASKSA